METCNDVCLNIGSSLFNDFINERHESLRCYYETKIDKIIECLTENNITFEELTDKLLYDETSKEYYSLYFLIIHALCPPISLIEQRIQEIRKEIG